MDSITLLQDAKALQDELVIYRRYLHSHPGVGYEIQDTLSYVKNTLSEIGYHPKEYGKAGLIAIIGDSTKGKTILLRADMDALAIPEEANVSYKSTNGNMHACGHDMHTTMLLGAAKLLKKWENRLTGQVILCFQPAEELLEGAKDMIQAGVLNDTSPDAALMIHTTVGMPLESGSVIVCEGGISAPAADYFSLRINGKGCHGAMPQLGVDPITVASYIVTALQELHARELSMFDDAALTFGSIQAGNTPNVIPNFADLTGTLRAYDDTTREYLKKRMDEIAQSIALAFRAKCTLTFTAGCPTLQNDSALSHAISGYMKELLGPQKAFTKSELTSYEKDSKTVKSTGSEDFAYFSHEVPSIMLALSAGKSSDGYSYPLHHPKVIFDESALYYGSAVYAYSAIRYLDEH